MFYNIKYHLKWFLSKFIFLLWLLTQILLYWRRENTIRYFRLQSSLISKMFNFHLSWSKNLAILYATINLKPVKQGSIHSSNNMSKPRYGADVAFFIAFSTEQKWPYLVLPSLAEGYRFVFREKVVISNCHNVWQPKYSLWTDTNCFC